MKKTVSILLTALMLFSCFAAMPVSGAANPTAAAVNENPIISWFTFGMTVKAAKELSPALSSFERGGSALSDSDIIRTGDTVITENDVYTAAVRGDVLGDGEATMFSYLAVKSHYLEVSTIEDPSALLAADVNSDGVIDMYDCLVIKSLYFETYEIPLPENAQQVPVLLYHHILEDEDKNTDKWMANDITIATGEFTRHMQMLEDGGHYVATVDEIVAYVRGEILLPPGSIVLTFDDGYKSNTYYAAPILREFGFKATVFSIMCLYEGYYQDYYSVDELQHITVTDLAMNDDVLEQQCHTWANHNQLSQQSYNQIYIDLMLSQDCYPSDYFAYPYGDYDSEVIRAVKEAGFKAAFSTTPVPAKPGDPLYEIPRITITSPMEDSEYLELLELAK